MQGDLLRASTALLKACSKPAKAATEPSSSLALFAKTEEQTLQMLQLEITFLRTPVTHRVPLFLNLPNALHKGSICLITPAPQSKYKELLEKEGHAQVKRVIDVEKLAAKFAEPVALRALANSFDHFFVHDRLKSFPAALTGEFLNHRVPVWMAHDKSLAGAIEKTCRVAVCPRRGNSTVSFVVGHSQMTAAEVKENVEAAFEQLKKHLEGGLNDILSARLCGIVEGGKRAALPVFAHIFDFTASAVEEKVAAAGGSSDELPAKRKKVAA